MGKVWNLETKAQESTDFLPKTKSNSSKTTGQERMTKIALGSTEEKHKDFKAPLRSSTKEIERLTAKDHRKWKDFGGEDDERG